MYNTHSQVMYLGMILSQLRLTLHVLVIKHACIPLSENIPTVLHQEKNKLVDISHIWFLTCEMSYNGS